MIYILLIICILCVGGTEQPIDIEKKYTKDKFLTLRALLAMQVVYGHTFPDNAYGIPILDKLLLPFNNTGFLCTSMFFFLSGYGVYESGKRNDAYFNHFLSKKIITIFLPYVTVNILYVLAEAVSIGKFDLVRAGLSFIWPIYNRSAWYVFSVFIVYCFMYLAIHLLKLRGCRLYAGLAIMLACYTVVFYMLKIGSWWYVSTYAVLFGVIFSDYKEEILKRIRAGYVFALFVVLYVGMLWLGEAIPYSLMIILKMGLSIVFPCAICLLMKRRKVETKWLNSVGKSSYEIYLVQGLFVQYLKLPWNSIYMNEIAPIVNVALSVLLGCILSKPINLMLKQIQGAKI